jgi:DDE family transposase
MRGGRRDPQRVFRPSALGGACGVLPQRLASHHAHVGVPLCRLDVANIPTHTGARHMWDRTCIPQTSAALVHAAALHLGCWRLGRFPGDVGGIATPLSKCPPGDCQRSDTAKGFIVLPKRWKVERTCGWCGKYRRLSKDYAYRTDTSEAMIHVVMMHIMVRRIALQTPFFDTRSVLLSNPASRD